jgi:hypothetical protein
MTTVFISRDKGLVFTDSRGTYADGTYEDNVTKRWKLDNERTVYGCGSVDEIQDALPYLNVGLPIRLKKSTIAVIKDGTKEVYSYAPNRMKFLGITFYQDSICEVMTTKHMALGSGASYLWGKLCAGFTVTEAFKQTYLQDIGSGGEIRTWEL